MAEVDALMVARHMFERETQDYDVTQEMIDEAWEQPELRQFWIDRAESVLEFIGFARG